MEKIGLVPAAGFARRLENLSGSKEMIPIDMGYGIEPVAHSLLRQFKNAAIDKIVVVTRPEKYDLLEYLSGNKPFDLDITTVSISDTSSTLESIFASCKVIQNKEVYLGFPDMIISPPDALRCLANAEGPETDIVLGAFPSGSPAKVDMIDIDEKGLLRDLKIKNAECRYKYSWIFAKWSPDFTDYFYKRYKLLNLNNDEEIYIGSFFLSYYLSGRDVGVCCVDDGNYTDIGTHEDLKKYFIAENN